GQESNPTTWRLAHMNLAIHSIEANLGPAPADTFLRDAHPDLKADFVLANPPFNVSDYSGPLLRGDKRWTFGDPPVGNANYAWITSSTTCRRTASMVK
ncbi:MAG: N-6 DNA methylase, partial [Planctomycetaceae bacterium]